MMIKSSRPILQPCLVLVAFLGFVAARFSDEQFLMAANIPRSPPAEFTIGSTRGRFSAGNMPSRGNMLSTSAPFDGDIPLSERSALESFYYSTGGSTWSNSNGWLNQSGSPCSWYGVLCYDAHVIGLRLGHNNLQGSLPESLSKLEKLFVLDISDTLTNYEESGSNSVAGTIPGSICGLSHLHLIDLSYNKIHGQIPNCVSSMRNLSLIYLEFTLISGELPIEICSMAQLRILSIRGANMTTHIPSCIGQAASLQVLDLSSLERDGSFFGPQRVIGYIPDSICELKSLVSLLAQFTGSLSGPIPSCLGVDQPLLSIVGLQFNKLSGSLSDALCSVANISAIILSGNLLAGTLSSCLGNLNSLDTLYILDNRLSGTIPEALCNIGPSLQSLSFSENSMHGTIPPCLSQLQSLESLEGMRNKLTGTIPASLCDIRSLTYFDFSSNNIRGTIPGCFGLLPTLQVFYLQDNQLSGTLPQVWNSTLVSLVLSNNRLLSGVLPPSLFHQQGLESPSSCLSSTSLVRSIVIEGAGLSGQLPACAICTANELETLALSGNRLSGSIFDCIGRLKWLDTLRLTNNNLSGTLPESFGNLTALRLLDLSSNRFHGSVPKGIGDISKHLAETNLQLNRLSCDLPDSVLEWEQSPDFRHVLLLTGNIFSCPGSSPFSLSMLAATGLTNANPVEATSYSCGGSDLVVPCFVIGTVVLPLLVGLAWVLWPTSKFSWAVCRCASLSDFTMILLGVTLASVVGLFLMLPVYMHAGSPYACQFTAEGTLAFKSGNNFPLSVVIGFGSALAIMNGLIAWWKNIAKGYIRSCHLIGAQDLSFAEDEDGDPLSAAQMTTFGRTARLFLQFLLMVSASVGPNVLYVYIVLNDQFDYNVKHFSSIMLAVAKASLAVLLIPHVTSRAAAIIIQGGVSEARETKRLDLRLNMSVFISALASLLAPIVVVLDTDVRCLYYAWRPPKADTNMVTVSYCSGYDSEGSCLGYAYKAAYSTYLPVFDYDGEKCFSAILQIYSSVFLVSVLLAAVLPASIELLLCPFAIPRLLDRKDSASAFALTALRLLSKNHRLILAARGEGELPVDEIQKIAAGIQERAFAQLIGTLLISLTVGLASPAVGFVCVVAACVQMRHHKHLLERVAELLTKTDGTCGTISAIKLPLGCGLTVMVSTATFWIGGSVRYFNAYGAFLGLIILLLAVLAIFLLFVCEKAGLRRKVAGSILLNPLLEEPRDRHENDAE